MTDTSLRQLPKMGNRAKYNTNLMLAYCNASSFVVFDRESTHFQPNEFYGKIIELSAVKIVDGIIVESFDMLINPEIKISSKITELTGISDEMVVNAPTYKQVLPEFVQFCEGSVVICHNAMPDIKFVNYFSSKLGFPFEPKYIDTISLCKYIDIKSGHVSDGKARYNLKEMTARYGIENNQHHRAMSDTVATAQLFLKLKELLGEDIKKGYFEKASLQLEDTSAAIIGSVNYWEKDINSKVYRRIYVRLILDDKTNDLYYDFTDKCWGIKKSEFKMPDLSIMTEKLKSYLHITDTTKVYDLSTYKKG